MSAELASLFPQGRNVTQFQVTDDVSKTLGNHTLKVRLQVSQELRERSRFGSTHNAVDVPISLADFANGGDPNAPGGIGTRSHGRTFPKSTNVPIRIYQVGLHSGRLES